MASLVEESQGIDWLSWTITLLALGIATAYMIYQLFRKTSKNSKAAPLSASTSSANPKFHVLIPCHVDSDRRALLFLRCIQSVNVQVYERFEVFISISGSSEYRKTATEFAEKVEAQSKVKWHIYDTEKAAVPQMEHLRSLVKRSAEADPDAYLMFLDNDDMFHPMRLVAFQEGLMNLQLPPGTPFALPCKLLLNETMGANEGRLTDLCSPSDYFLWQKNPSLRRKVQWVPTSRSDEMDATEYMDFMVPTSVMQKFFRLTPVGITSHKFCDLRLLAILERLNPMEIGDIPQYPWLLAHYKTSMGTKWKNFDSHGKGQALGAHSLDQASVGKVEPTAQDVALSKRGRKLSPGQVALCRGHLESLIIQYIGWDDKTLAEVKRAKTAELSRLHGRGLADDLWKEVVAQMTALFPYLQIFLNRGAWQCMIDE